MPDNPISLRHYIETLMDQYKESHAREHILLAENVQRTKENLDVRLEGMNQFRSQILSERHAMVSNDRFEAKCELTESRIEELEKGLSNLRGRMTATTAALAAGLAILQIVLYLVGRN